ncbi:MAG: hypothetical protein CMM12_08635 [Rhodospirillaceae bacterium]|nr:hypothetical protein [Rhodospirillaceae bacterium]
MSAHEHIVLTSHTPVGAEALRPINWGVSNPIERGPVIGTVTDPAARNTVGTHSGSYSVYLAASVAAGRLDPNFKPDLHNTAPVAEIGPYPQWSEPRKIVSLDPFGHMVTEIFADDLAAGVDIRPTIAITQARLSMLEIREAVSRGRLKADGKILSDNGDVYVTKIAVDPVWHLPGMAERLSCDTGTLRRALFTYTGGMYPELVTRSDLEIFLPPIGGLSAYVFGDPKMLADQKVPLACRVHDECNGSDVFGSDICTCRPYLTHGIEMCVEMAQAGGNGLVVYNRKEGRALGEVTKFLVYNARKRQEEGDNAARYFERTECVAGVQDARFQELMPDIFHWLGVSRLDRFASMSDMKHDALARQGIDIGERVDLPEELIPEDAKVEMEAKKAAGYFTSTDIKDADELKDVKGRALF